MSEDYIAFVDTHFGGVVIGCQVLDKRDPLTEMMNFVKSLKYKISGIQQVTFVEPCVTKPSNPYAHPTHPGTSNGFIETPTGVKWLKLILSVSMDEEE